MPDWNTRLEVKLGTQTLSPVTSFTTNFSVPHTVLHSIEADNVGLIRQPMTITFTMASPAIGTAVADLTELALNRGEFAIAVAEKEGTDWTFKAMKFQRCIVTSAAPSNVVIDGVPQANFTCMALSVSIEV
jgi:hypothetical protein